MNPGGHLEDDHPLLALDELEFTGPADISSVKQFHFAAPSGGYLANCSSTGTVSNPVSQMWMKGQAVIEIRADGRGMSELEDHGVPGGCEWSILDAASRELIARIDLMGRNRSYDLFTVPIRNAHRIEMGRMTGAFRIGRWLPGIAMFIGRRVVIRLGDRVVAQITAPARIPVRNRNRRSVATSEKRFSLRFSRGVTPGDRIVVFGLCLVIARTGLP